MAGTAGWRIFGSLPSALLKAGSGPLTTYAAVAGLPSGDYSQLAMSE
jgi:hypothetical protein